MQAIIDSWCVAGLVRPIDQQFARFIVRLDGRESPELALGALLASNALDAGHVCADLFELGGQALFDGVVSAPCTETWIRRLRGSQVVGSPGGYQPLILDDAGRLYLYRYHAYETQIAGDLIRRAEDKPKLPDLARLQGGLARLFPASGVTPDWQKIAAAGACFNRLTVINGGPGTGKTATVMRILALLAELDDGTALRVAVAAPTGKAAARLALAAHDARCSGVEVPPVAPCTLHRLLGASWLGLGGPRPGSGYGLGNGLGHGGSHYGRDHLLPLDILVIDEVSMVDLALMAKILEALPATARLILLGDKDQLASIEAGAVLSALCARAPGVSPGFKAELAEVTLESIPDDPRAAPVMRDAVITLRHSYRFAQNSGIAKLARAINSGDSPACRKILSSDHGSDLGPDLSSDLNFEPWDVDGDVAVALARVALQGYASYFELIAEGGDIASILAAYHSFRILVPWRLGLHGSIALNAHIEALLRREGLIAGRELWYAGRPILVIHNDYELQLYNGDLGVVLPDPRLGGDLRAHFSAAGGPKSVALNRLPAFELSYVMTVHKAQGSEFERVCLALPESQSNAARGALNRELLYTGVTRAVRHLLIRGSIDDLCAAVARSLQRRSGLAAKLWSFESPGTMDACI